MAKLRTFVAIEIPDELKMAADRLIVKLKPFGPDIRWVRAANLHFTLRFLGDIDQQDIPKLSESIKNNVTGLKPFPLRLAGLGCFPNLKRPRVVWLGADGELEALKQLAFQVESACRTAGFGKGDKPFSAHLTIGRIRESRGLESFIKRLGEAEFESGEFMVDEVTLFKSDLSPRGPTYTPLAKLKLER